MKALLVLGVILPALVGASFEEAMQDHPGDIGRALASRALIRANRQDSLGYYGLSYGLYQMGRNEEALPVYDELEKIPHPTPEYVPSDRGVVLMRLGRYDEAIKGFERSIAMKANFGHAHFSLAVALIRTGGDMQAALGHLAVADANDADFTHAYHRVYRGAALYKLGRYSEALAELDGAIAQTSPSFALLNFPSCAVDALYEQHYYRARTLLALGRPADAKAALEEVFKVRQFRLTMKIPVRASNRPSGAWPCYEDPDIFVTLFNSWELP